MKRALAVLEVTLAFLLVHVGYRSFKRFTELGRAEAEAGLNFSPGLAMIVFTVAAVLVRARTFEEYGLTWKGWRFSLNLGLLWSAAFIVMAGVLDRFAGMLVGAVPEPEITRPIVATLIELVSTLVLLWILLRDRGVLERTHPGIALVFLALLLPALALAAFHFERSIVGVLLAALWLFFGAGFGEEIFFRGYMQTRVDEAFGRPCRFMGAEFGWGLVVSSLFFGFIHVLNPVDYFASRFDFAWSKWPQYFAAGLFLGVLRERTKSILAGGIIHGLTDVAGKLPELLH